uniref:Uncharacterized protein n=1 Tax=Anguilla anguilla TaxID=7936 RepID=A0A0E9P8E4_ANGAN
MNMWSHGEWEKQASGFSYRDSCFSDFKPR